MFITQDISDGHRTFIDHAVKLAPEDAAPHVRAYLERLAARGIAPILDREHFAFCVGTELGLLTSMAMEPRRRYRAFRIAKRNGGSRLIEAPLPVLRLVQRWIHENVLLHTTSSEHCIGFRTGHSTGDAARPHEGAEMVARLDLKDFFHSVDSRATFRVFRRLGYHRDLSWFLTRLCTVNGRLPQGAPTSPLIANLAADDMDRRIAGITRKREVTYTRYADDLTFSGALHAVVRTIPLAERIIRDEGFHPRDSKRYYADRSQRQEVLGLVVNESARPSREYRRSIRQEIHFIGKFGLADHARSLDEAPDSCADRLRGQLNYLMQFAPDEARALRTKFECALVGD